MTPGEIETELEAHHRAGFAWSLACCGRDREEAEDVLQTSYLKILDGRAEFAGRSSFKTFLFGVIRKTASESRRRRRSAELFLGRPERIAPPPPEPVPEERLALLRALARLPRRQREVLDLVFYVGMTVEEAGRVLGVSAGSARAHYDRGKRRMARILAVRTAGVEESHG
ncbi:MAG: RNA polymerase sigma factor [Acidobacteriota bacterium]|nr:RNA polymerase sigma factor [Acidobacteriota bacterium]